MRTTNFSCAIKTSRAFHFAYQSGCGEQWLQERHWVSVHWCRHAGLTSPVSKVVHSLLHVQKPFVLFAGRLAAECTVNELVFE